MWTLNSEITNFDSFGVEHTPKEFPKHIPKKIIGNKNIKTSILKIQANN